MGYTFSKASEAKLAGLDPLMVRVVRRAMGYQTMDFTVIQTLRTPEEAAANLAKGTSATTRSKHLPDARGLSRAVDLAPFPINWNDTKRFGILMGLMAAAAKEEGVKIRLGGNWDGDNDFHDNRPEDPGHFELV
jgi:peptidoglycan LD-endopeptidase CwlK